MLSIAFLRSSWKSSVSSLLVGTLASEYEIIIDVSGLPTSVAFIIHCNIDSTLHSDLSTLQFSKMQSSAVSAWELFLYAVVVTKW